MSVARAKPGSKTSYNGSPLFDRLDDVLVKVSREVVSALDKFPPFNSPHEGKAVIEEELDELWEHVKANTGTSAEARVEAIQIAAMAIRYVLDIAPANSHSESRR